MTTIGDAAVGIAFPDDAAYRQATQVFNLTSLARPAAAATVTSLSQIRAAIRYADRHGLALRVHTTGHGSANASPMADALLVRTQLPGGVDIDATTRTARIPAGTRWGEVANAAAAYGLAAPHGSSPLVGVVGYLLRGGVSCYGRQIGVAANSVRAVELVTADGELYRATATSDPELLWALRGGGGGFGIVTAVEINLFPVAGVITGAAYWPAAHASRLLATWLDWARNAPPEATTSLRLMNLPDLPVIPPPLRAASVVCVDGVVVSQTADMSMAQRQAEDLLGPLRSQASPLLDTWRPTTALDVLETHMDPAEPVPIVGDHMLLNSLDGGGAAELLSLASEGSGSPLTNAELRQLGGGLAIPDPAGGVFSHIDAAFAFISAGVPFGPVRPEAIAERCAAIRAALAPWDTGRTAPSLVENLAQPQRHLSPDQIDAVARVRSRVDPLGRFRGDVAPSARSLPVP